MNGCVDEQREWEKGTTGGMNQETDDGIDKGIDDAMNEVTDGGMNDGVDYRMNNFNPLNSQNAIYVMTTGFIPDSQRSARLAQ